MATTPRRTKMTEPEHWYDGANIPLRVIRRFARQVAERFGPEKSILFGSHAYGTPHADSDVDILVVMPARNQLDMAFKIRLAVSAPFPHGPPGAHAPQHEMAPGGARVVPDGNRGQGQGPL